MKLVLITFIITAILTALVTSYIVSRRSSEGQEEYHYKALFKMYRANTWKRKLKKSPRKYEKLVLSLK